MGDILLKIKGSLLKFRLTKYLLLRNFAYLKLQYVNLLFKLGIMVHPTSVNWPVTYKCNFTCPHCEADANQIVDELNTDEALKVIDELAIIRPQLVAFSGGEPLVRKDIWKLIGHANKYDLRVSLITNSYLIRKFQAEFKKVNICNIFTSLDGIESYHDKFRGVKGSFKNLMWALDFYRKQGVESILVSTFVNQDNFDQLDKIKKIISMTPTTIWRLGVAIPHGRAEDNPRFFLTTEQTKELFAFARKARKDLGIKVILCEDLGYMGAWADLGEYYPFSCSAGIMKFGIMPDGEILGCQVLYDNKYSEGNVRDKSLVDMWKNGFKMFRDPTLPDKCEKCKFKRGCMGGCYGMRKGDMHCSMQIWDPDYHKELEFKK